MVEKRFEKLGMPDIERFENYLPTAFNSELTLLQKVNKIIFDLIESNKLTNEMIDYLNQFIEKFDEKSYESVLDVLNEWLVSGEIKKIINDEIFSDINNKIKEIELENDDLFLGLSKKRDKDVKIKSIDLDTSSDQYKIGLINLSDEVISSITGDVPTNNVIANGAISSEKIANEAVIYDKLSNDVISKTFDGMNIFNKKNILKGMYLDNDGIILKSDTLGLSFFIDVIPDQFYTTPNPTSLSGGFYDKDKNFIGAISYVSGSTLKTPSNCRYIRVNVNMVDINNVIYIDKYMLVYGKSYGMYRKYGASGYHINVEGDNISNDTITGENLKKIRNIFNKDTVIRNTYISNDGTQLPSETLGLSDFIEIEPETYYTFPLGYSSMGGIYDSNKMWIGNIEGKTTYFQNKAKYIRVNVNISDNSSLIYSDVFMIVKDNKYPSKYVGYNIPFFPFLLETYLPLIKSDNTNESEGKSFYAFGDSITWYDGKVFGGAHSENGQVCKGYLSYIRNDLGYNVSNFGISGGTIQNQISNSIKEKSYANVDVVSITGGVNDWTTTSQTQPPIGVVQPIGSTFNLDTTIGALQSSIEHIIKSNKKTKIYLITPIRGYLKETSEHPKAGQEFPKEYAEMFKNIGLLYGIPVCDWFDLVGFNRLNYDYYYKDVGILSDRYIHVGNLGYKRMAEVLIPFLRSY